MSNIEPLSPSGQRALAAAAIREADPAVPPPVATALVDVLDGVSAAVLSPPTCRDVPALLWAPETGGTTQWGG